MTSTIAFFATVRYLQAYSSHNTSLNVVQFCCTQRPRRIKHNLVNVRSYAMRKHQFPVGITSCVVQYSFFYRHLFVNLFRTIAILKVVVRLFIRFYCLLFISHLYDPFLNTTTSIISLMRSAILTPYFSRICFPVRFVVITVNNRSSYRHSSSSVRGVVTLP